MLLVEGSKESAVIGLGEIPKTAVKLVEGLAGGGFKFKTVNQVRHRNLPPFIVNGLKRGTIIFQQREFFRRKFGGGDVG